MYKPGTVKLIAVSPEARGAGTNASETEQEVFCTVKSIGMQEAYQAMAMGLNPELKICLPHDFEYQDEPLLDYNGRRYKIIRTYITEKDGIELTVQRVTGNAKGSATNEPV